MMDDPIVIVGMARTPMGGFQGALKDARAPELGSAAIEAALGRAGVAADEVDEVIMGNILSAGQGQAPARQASIGAGIPEAVGCTTINKMCGSGMKATMFAHDLIAAGSGDIVVAGGMESMTNAPYLLDRARGGYRMGHGKVQDHMFLDGLEDAYDKGKLMGHFAEETARTYQFTREQQDAFAITSLTRAKTAIEDGSFDGEVTPVTVKHRKGETVVAPGRAAAHRRSRQDPDAAPGLRQGRLGDRRQFQLDLRRRRGAGADAALRGRAARALDPVAVIHGHATHAQAPAWFTTAPGPALRKLFEKIGWVADDVDLYEINEAFAVVAMAAMRDLDLDHDKVNVHGGACALGHPVGASGARIVITLLAALEKYGLDKGAAALCIGGGEATALAVERLH